MDTVLTGGFGRRVVESESRDLTLVRTTPIPGSQVHLSGRDDLKERVRSELMSRIDPSVAGSTVTRSPEFPAMIEAVSKYDAPSFAYSFPLPRS